MLVYKRVTGLAGHTSRVSELLERIRGLSRADEEETLRRLYLRWALGGGGCVGVGGWVAGWVHRTIGACVCMCFGGEGWGRRGV